MSDNRLKFRYATLARHKGMAVVILEWGYHWSYIRRINSDINYQVGTLELKEY